MRILFFGTSAFAVPTLDSLHQAAPRHEIIAVVTQPDRPSGRGMKLSPSPIKVRAEELGYSVLQPEKVRRKPFPAEVAAMTPDALVVVSFGQIIPQAMLALPRYGESMSMRPYFLAGVARLRFTGRLSRAMPKRELQLCKWKPHSIPEPST